MISNLNQFSFRAYGEIISEGHSCQVPEQVGISKVQELSRDDIPIWICTSEVRLCNQSNMTVLSVSVDGEDFQHFYLDKSISIRPGVHFSIYPYQDRSSVRLSYTQELQEVGLFRAGDELYQLHHAQVKTIYTFFYQEKERGFTFPGECHQPLELTYVDKGEIHSVANGVDLRLGQGDIVIYGSDQWHMQYADIDMSPCFITITFDLDGDYPPELINRKIPIPRNAVSILQRMLQELERMDDYSMDMIMCLLQSLLLELLREQCDPSQSKLLTSNAVNAQNEIIRRAQQYISEHVRDKLTVPLVAHHAEVSPSYLTALFRNHLKISPGEYIRRIKLQEGKQMIRDEDLNFTEIAAILQYSTVHHFSRQFKDKFGITPTEYAKSVR